MKYLYSLAINRTIIKEHGLDFLVLSARGLYLISGSSHRFVVATELVLGIKTRPADASKARRNQVLVVSKPVVGRIKSQILSSCKHLMELR